MSYLSIRQSDKSLRSVVSLQIVLGTAAGAVILGTLLVVDEYTGRGKTNMNVHGFRAMREKVMILGEIAIGVEFAQPMVHASPRPSSVYS